MMEERALVLNSIKHFFELDELACPHSIKKWGEKTWNFFQLPILINLLVIRRDIIQKPMYCNGGSHTQRGLRCNLCELVKTAKDVYLTQHLMGNAFDLTSPYYTAEQMRQMIKENAHKLPYPMRMEKDVNWLHIDCLPFPGSEKIYEFKA